MKISVIIPTLNEERALPGVLANLRESAQAGEIEIIVSDGGSRDGTQTIAQTQADKLISSEPGRAEQMNQGALAASGDILLFLHADTRLPANWRTALLQVWSQSPRPAVTAFTLSFDKNDWRYRLIARASALRTRLTGVPMGDQALAVWRKDYLGVGGFPKVPIMEEYLLIQKMRRLGQVRVLDARITTSIRRYEKNGPLFNALKNSLIIFLFYIGVSPQTLKRMYR